MVANELLQCPRCGFRVNLEGATEKGRAKLQGIFDQHVADCPTLPSADLRRRLKAEITRPWIKRDPAKQREIAERYLAEAGEARDASRSP